jgi:hypothetical protein
VFRGTIGDPARRDQLELAIPRAALGLTKEPFTIDFKWADNLQQTGEWSDFTLNGDAAPNDRFNYRATFRQPPRVAAFRSTAHPLLLFLVFGGVNEGQQRNHQRCRGDRERNHQRLVPDPRPILIDDLLFRSLTACRQGLVDQGATRDS